MAAFDFKASRFKDKDGETTLRNQAALKIGAVIASNLAATQQLLLLSTRRLVLEPPIIGLVTKLSEAIV